MGNRIAGPLPLCFAVFLQGVSCMRSDFLQASTLLCWASWLQRVKPFISLTFCSHGCFQYPTRAKYSCCRQRRGVTHVTRSRRATCSPESIPVCVATNTLTFIKCCTHPAVHIFNVTFISTHLPVIQPWSYSCTLKKEVYQDLSPWYWGRLNCIWPYFHGSHFDLTQSHSGVSRNY